ncbi:SHOCT domain protein [Acididesulfobacillus acetoxydans]|uniref:SHOCT domain protein n=1 Tax=Acididesulfobacillus acetoxydans TaxID=1561005 RepID=A0A8S0Y343_9FIRM|nr:SHOCT domain-containing protein [Acididesulfobacillus acetoxydans]CAA7601575.1 SHOCT domain protein [Acididesulfobacillus acetoxydans]CEJ07062.1 Short C-terminal domain [Acididesulfobacillus acetoxydans]
MMGWGYGAGMMRGFGLGYYGGYTGSGGAWWSGLVGMAAQILFWLVIIGLGIYVFRRLSFGVSGNSRGTDGALSTLRERYARGEIGREEYQRCKADLK